MLPAPHQRKPTEIERSSGHQTSIASDQHVVPPEFDLPSTMRGGPAIVGEREDRVAYDSYNGSDPTLFSFSDIQDHSFIIPDITAPLNDFTLAIDLQDALDRPMRRTPDDGVDPNVALIPIHSFAQAQTIILDANDSVPSIQEDLSLSAPPAFPSSITQQPVQIFIGEESNAADGPSFEVKPPTPLGCYRCECGAVLSKANKSKNQATHERSNNHRDALNLPRHEANNLLCCYCGHVYARSDACNRHERLSCRERPGFRGKPRKRYERKLPHLRVGREGKKGVERKEDDRLSIRSSSPQFTDSFESTPTSSGFPTTPMSAPLRLQPLSLSYSPHRTAGYPALHRSRSDDLLSGTFGFPTFQATGDFSPVQDVSTGCTMFRGTHATFEVSPQAADIQSSLRPSLSSLSIPSPISSSFGHDETSFHQRAVLQTGIDPCERREKLSSLTSMRSLEQGYSDISPVSHHSSVSARDAVFPGLNSHINQYDWAPHGDTQSQSHIRQQGISMLDMSNNLHVSSTQASTIGGHSLLFDPSASFNVTDANDSSFNTQPEPDSHHTLTPISEVQLTSAFY